MRLNEFVLDVREFELLKLYTDPRLAARSAARTRQETEDIRAGSAPCRAGSVPGEMLFGLHPFSWLSLINRDQVSTGRFKAAC
jgi:hypothetical protein